MSLLNQTRIQGLISQAQNKVNTSRETLRTLQSHAPSPGMKRLDSPEEKAVWQRFVQTQATQEQMGTAPGDVATHALQHPAVREGFAEAQNGE